MTSDRSFLDLGLPRQLVSSLSDRGIHAPFPIQQATITDAMAGRDVCGRAPTGAGKTLAFGIPVALRSGHGRPGRPRTLVLVPTRELANQVHAELSFLLEAVNTKSEGLRSHPVFGGVSFEGQLRALRRGVDIIVACPGRLADLVSQGACDLSDVDLVVIDEADRMADMGFLPEIRRLVDRCRPDRQTLLFSATLDEQVDVLIRAYQRDPARHEHTPPGDVDDRATHLFWAVEAQERLALTAAVINRAGSTVVFCRTKHGADRVARQLESAGIRAAAIHGNRSQPQRERALAAFHRGDVTALVATDVAARGIHVDDVACVIHFDAPADAKDYVHRSGRTARAGASGTVVSLVTPNRRSDVSGIQRALGHARHLDPADVEAVPKTARARRPRHTLGASDSSGSAVGPRTKRANKTSGSPTPNGRAKPGRTPKTRSNTGARAGDASQIDLRAGARPKNTRGSKRQARPNADTTGTIKFFNKDKGFGFVARANRADLFFHYTNISGAGNNALREGQRVTFDVEPGRRGREAKNLRPI